MSNDPVERATQAPGGLIVGAPRVQNCHMGGENICYLPPGYHAVLPNDAAMRTLIHDMDLRIHALVREVLDLRAKVRSR